MAKREDIETDLALEIEGHEDSKKFLKAVDAFIRYVEEVAKTSAGDKSCPEWTVQVKKASNLIGMHPSSGFDPAIKQRMYAMVREGISGIVDDGVLPVDHSKKALGYLRKIGEVADDSSSPRLWVERKPLRITQKVAADIKAHFKVRYQDYGSVEGALQLIAERGNYRAEITDPLSNEPIKCFLSEDLMEIARGMFGQRMGAYGKITYKEDGSIVNIEVEELVPFPPDEEIPSFREVRGIFKD